MGWRTGSSAWLRVLLVGTLVTLALTAAAFLVGLGWLVYRFAPPSDRAVAAIRADGSEIVGQLEEYRVRHGVYPPTLSEGGIEAPAYRGGRWCYHTSGDGQQFALWIPLSGHPGLAYHPDQGSFVEMDDSD